MRRLILINLLILLTPLLHSQTNEEVMYSLVNTFLDKKYQSLKNGIEKEIKYKSSQNKNYTDTVFNIYLYSKIVPNTILDLRSIYTTDLESYFYSTEENSFKTASRMFVGEAENPDTTKWQSLAMQYYQPLYEEWKPEFIHKNIVYTETFDELREQYEYRNRPFEEIIHRKEIQIKNKWRFRKKIR